MYVGISVAYNSRKTGALRRGNLSATVPSSPSPTLWPDERWFRPALINKTTKSVKIERSRAKNAATHTACHCRISLDITGGQGLRGGKGTFKRVILLLLLPLLVL